MAMALVLVAIVVLVASSCADDSNELLWNRLQGTLPPAAIQEAAARGVIRRFLPRHAPAFELGIVSIDSCGGRPCFHVTSSKAQGNDVEIRINATSGVELCAGFHWYLKTYCGAHLSWDATGGSQVTTVPEPQELPALPLGGVKVQRPVPWNYYQNVVTSSYSYVWWDFTRWRKEVDWMALQGINLPLAFTGQEAVWQKVFQNTFNLSKGDLDDYFGGPAFLAWARMGNLHGWGGPLSQDWLDSQLRLQKRVLQHMRSLGMIAVLPAFSGNVPAALKTMYPSANITRLPEWNTVDGNPRWCCTYLLQPTDPLFVQIGKAFIQQQTKEYGLTQHIYNCDTFNENLPPTNDPSYISSLAAAVFEAMTAGDKDAVWLMQGWLFSSDAQFWKPPQMQALLHAVPFGRMIVLDLFAEVRPIWSQSNHFYGVPYIWCMLHNFGGNHEMYGRLEMLLSGPVDARTSDNSTMVGVGMCMEGIEQNPVVYELMAEMAFRPNKSSLQDWTDNYSTRRYGHYAASARMAWRILSQTVYNCSDGIADHNTDVIVKFPDLDPSAAWTRTTVIQEKVRRLLDDGFGHIWYAPSEARRALSCMLNASALLGKTATYRYDLVDLTRQVLSKLANELLREALVSFAKGNTRELEMKSNTLLGLISDMELVLRSNDGFLLGPWLESAKRLAKNKADMALYEWNARTQVTMWFDNAEELPSRLHDYANKMWSGLVRDYYLPRASLYVSLLQQASRENKPFPYQEWRKQWISLTNKWQNATNVYPSKARGDSVEISKLLYRKYVSSAVASEVFACQPN